MFCNTTQEREELENEIDARNEEIIQLKEKKGSPQ